MELSRVFGERRLESASCRVLSFECALSTGRVRTTPLLRESCPKQPPALSRLLCFRNLPRKCRTSGGGSGWGQGTRRVRRIPREAEELGVRVRRRKKRGATPSVTKEWWVVFLESRELCCHCLLLALDLKPLPKQTILINWWPLILGWNCWELDKCRTKADDGK